MYAVNVDTWASSWSRSFANLRLAREYANGQLMQRGKRSVHIKAPNGREIY